MNKQHCLVKRLKREIADELVKDSIQEEGSVHKFEESVYKEMSEEMQISNKFFE